MKYKRQLSSNSRGIRTEGNGPYFRHALRQFPWYRGTPDRFDRVVLATLIIEMCVRESVRSLHVRYPACRSAISVSLDCLKDDRASKFIPSLEIDVIH